MIHPLGHIRPVHLGRFERIKNSNVTRDIQHRAAVCCCILHVSLKRDKTVATEENAALCGFRCAGSRHVTI